MPAFCSRPGGKKPQVFPLKSQDQKVFSHKTTNQTNDTNPIQLFATGMVHISANHFSVFMLFVALAVVPLAVLVRERPGVVGAAAGQERDQEAFGVVRICSDDGPKRRGSDSILTPV